eukprot:scaffold38372_cov244-Amphora_coffeaeformis.AAC.2
MSSPPQSAKHERRPTFPLPVSRGRHRDLVHRYQNEAMRFHQHRLILEGQVLPRRRSHGPDGRVLCPGLCHVWVP